MSNEDVVKMTIYSTNFGTRITTVVSREDAASVLDSFMSPASSFIQVEGRLNDYDNNKIHMTFRTESIGGIDITDINKRS